jgi:hypothetical protein
MTARCECGCGLPAPLAKRTRRALGHVKGQPLRFITGHNRARERTPDSERYLVEDRGYSSPCWIWRLAINPQTGYGVTTVEGVARNAHRESYERLVARLPDRVVLDHLCRNRACVNPAHMEPVTDAINLRRGDGCRLSEAQVVEIHSRAWAGELQKGIAAEFGIHPTHVSAIKLGKRWTDVVAA